VVGRFASQKAAQERQRILQGKWILAYVKKGF
jgi:hypothetical protein